MTTNPTPADPSAARATLRVGDSSYRYYDLTALGIPDLDRLPYTVKVLIENAARHAASGSGLVTTNDLATLAAWRPDTDPGTIELPFLPARVILQDFTGVPCVVDLAAMRDAIADMGGDPDRVNPLVPADLVIDHSVQVDQYGSDAAFLINVEREYERNGERYALLRWAQGAFANFRVVPPGTGIVHQVNLEYLADVVTARPDADGTLDRLPRHAGRDRLAHDHDQRPGRRRLGRGRDRGRGRAPRPAAVPANARGGRLPPRRGAAPGHHRHRPGADRDRDAPRPRRGGQVRRVPRRRALAPRARRPGHDQQHEPRVRGHRHAVPGRRRDPPLPADDRTRGRGGRAGRGLRQGSAPVPDRCLTGADVQRVPATGPGRCRALPRRAEAPAGPGVAARFAGELPDGLCRRAGPIRHRFA